MSDQKQEPQEITTKQQFQEIMEDTFETLRELTATKGEEYSGNQDQLANFRRSANDAGITPAKAWLVFFNKHIDAIKFHVKNLAVRLSEPIEGRIDDAILYLLLYKAYVIESKRRVSIDKVPADTQLGRANPRCEWCHGTGRVGHPNGIGADSISSVCVCVKKTGVVAPEDHAFKVPYVQE